MSPEAERGAWRLLRAAFRLARGRTRAELRCLGERALDAGATDWHRWRRACAPLGLRQRASRRAALGGVLRALAGATLEASKQGDHIAGGEAADLTGRPGRARADALDLARWRAHKLARGAR
jgi:hypothetical protein